MYESLWADIQKLSQISKTFKCVIKCSVIATLVLSVQLLLCMSCCIYAARPLTSWALLLCLKVKHFRRSVVYFIYSYLLYCEKGKILFQRIWIKSVSKNNRNIQIILIFIFVFSCCSSMEKHEITSLTYLQGKKIYYIIISLYWYRYQKKIQYDMIVSQICIAVRQALPHPHLLEILKQGHPAPCLTPTHKEYADRLLVKTYSKLTVCTD